MASGREREQENHPLGRRSGRQRSYDRQLSRDDISNQSRFLLGNYIESRLQREGLQNVPHDLIEPGTPMGPHIDRINEVALALRQIGDELDGNEQLQRLISQVRPDASEMTFMNVAREIFRDGTVNWGRIVTLFYFAFRLTSNAIRQSLDYIPVVRNIMEWVVTFIREYIAAWIIDRGGWEAIVEYYGTPMMQFAGVVFSAVLVTAFIMLRNSWSR